MELTNGQLEAIREAARTVEYGSVTVHISAVSKHLDLEIHKRVRTESEPEKKIQGPFGSKKHCGCFEARNSSLHQNFFRGSIHFQCEREL
jgi:hypothetical protein